MDSRVLWLIGAVVAVVLAVALMSPREPTETATIPAPPPAEKTVPSVPAPPATTTPQATPPASPEPPKQ
ncbi:hypothetical protein ACO2I3_05015 [Leptospira interrogans]